jgi:hypothetical protein
LAFGKAYALVKKTIALGDLLHRNQEKKMKKVITTLTAVAFALGLAGAGMAQTVSKDAAKPAVKTEIKTSQSQVAPKPADKPVSKEAAKSGAKEVKKTDAKEKGKETAKKTAKKEKKVGKKGDCPVDKTKKEGKKL